MCVRVDMDAPYAWKAHNRGLFLDSMGVVTG